MATAHCLEDIVVDADTMQTDEALRARLELTLDALTAVIRGLQIRDGKRVTTYAKLVDDKAHMTAEQQAALDFAKAVLVEAGR